MGIAVVDDPLGDDLADPRQRVQLPGGGGVDVDGEGDFLLLWLGGFGRRFLRGVGNGGRRLGGNRGRGGLGRLCHKDLLQHNHRFTGDGFIDGFCGLDGADPCVAAQEKSAREAGEQEHQGSQRCDGLIFHDCPSFH